MISQLRKNGSIERLLLKITGYIGHSTRRYVSDLLSGSLLSSIELEIIERILSMGFYSDDVIEKACSVALEKRVFNVVDLNLLISEIDMYRL
jgi:hypothetical protein